MLDDAPGDQTARERFRQYLMKSVSTIGTVRDHTETCLRESGPQYSRALQDLVNHTARLLGFSVEFGRYQGVAGEIGYDGIWRFGDMTIVVEVKTNSSQRSGSRIGITHSACTPLGEPTPASTP
jgi:hypothetical protein